MIYLYWYVGIGAVIFVAAKIRELLKKSSDGDRIDDLPSATDLNQKRWRMLIRYIGEQILIITLFLTLWPVAIYMNFEEMIMARRPKIEEPPEKFAVTSEHLQRQWSLAEIEAEEVVIDPLGAAPRLPFGHLNPAWENFKKSIDVKRHEDLTP